MEMESRRPGSVSSPAHVLSPTSEMLTPEIRISTLENKSGPEKELKWKVMENGILDAIMEIKEGIP